jgi:1,4-alpha-glucan branching enzyme
MADTLGTLCIVLHGHLPYVLHHGSYPHGEAWLYEGAAETYLPLLDMIGECALLKARPALTIGLTPVLLEQLAHDRFKRGFADYLSERIERSIADRREFEKTNQPHMAYLAQQWEKWHTDRLEHFNRIDRDIPREYARRLGEGHIQILTSNATHAYMPLMLDDRSIRAQMSAGGHVSRQRLGVQPRGMWLPECAYRPHWPHWQPSVWYNDVRNRPGLETFIAGAGVTHFFVDTHLITGCQPLGTWDQKHFQAINEIQIHWDVKRGWRDVLEPVGVASEAQAPQCFAMGRHPRVSEQVWSGAIGYPGNGVYLEFHKKHGERGLRYWKITNNKADLGSKDPYYPDDVAAKIYENAQHFCSVVREVLAEHRERTGRRGVCIAPFDAELFGHWWFEGPRFLRDVILTLANDKTIELATAEEAITRQVPDKVARLPEGSWGQKGDHSVWMNEQTSWMWEIEYRAETRMQELLHKLPWRSNGRVAAMLQRAGRQLLLLQASDWPFVVRTHGAVDYGIQRLAGHATQFDRASKMAEEAADPTPLPPAIAELRKIELAEMDAHDNIFPDIDLNWWV